MNANLRPYLAAAIALPLTACAHAAMMGGMGLGIGMTGHHRGATACESEARAMEAHLQRVDTIGAEKLAAIIPAHVRRLEALLDGCESRPSDVSPSADTVRVTAGALREDLSRLRQVSPSELGVFMPAHTDRIRTFLSLQHRGREDHSHTRGEMDGHDALTPSSRLPQLMTAAGFQDVREMRRFAVPLGTVSLYRGRKADEEVDS